MGHMIYISQSYDHQRVYFVEIFYFSCNLRDILILRGEKDKYFMVQMRFLQKVVFQIC